MFLAPFALLARHHRKVSVVVNSPPSSGSFSAIPTEGVALTTSFSLSCEAWVDEAEDLPLR